MDQGSIIDLTREAVPTGAATRPRVSVCMVTGRRSALLDACLASLREQEAPPPFELLVAADRDISVADSVREYFPGATVGLVSGTYPGASRNYLLNLAKGDLLLFIDDDVVVRPDLLRRLDEISREHPEAGVFGGPNMTPVGSSCFQIVQGAVLGSIVAAGPVRRRYGAHPAGPTTEIGLTLCNLAVRREAMVPFAAELLCAEENGVMAELREAGVAMRYEPDLVVYHERRDRPSGFARQMKKYGRGRGQLIRRKPSTLRPSHLAPSAFLTYAVLVPLLVWSDGLAALLPLAVYALAVAAGAVRVTASIPGQARLRVLAWAVSLIVLLHVCYGLGVLRGLALPGLRTIRTPNWQLLERPTVAVDLTTP